MSIRFSCSCGRKLKVSDEKIGMKVLCSSCGTTLKVPKKSQDTYWQDVETPSKEAQVDYVGGVRDFLIQLTPGAIVLVLLVWGAYYLSSLVITGNSSRPPLGTVTGTVTLNGKPLENAMVRFLPVVEKGSRIAPSLGLTDSQGWYRLFYVRDVPGAAVGEHRIEIEVKGPGGRERLPPEYNRESTLRHAVESGSQTIDFKLDMAEEEPTAAAPQEP